MNHLQWPSSMCKVSSRTNKALWCGQETKAIVLLGRKLSFTNNHRQCHKTHNLTVHADKSWATVAWTCIRTFARVKWCNHRHHPSRPQQQLISSNKTWILINRVTISIKTPNRATTWIGSVFRNSISSNRAVVTAEWWQRIINSNRDSARNGKVKPFRQRTSSLNCLPFRPHLHHSFSLKRCCSLCHWVR